MSKIQTWLPVFPGCYGTHFDPDDLINQELDYLNNELNHNVTYEDLGYDHKSFLKDLGQKCCEFIEMKLKELGLIRSITFEQVRSPREYNFANDAIDCTIDVYTGKLRAYLNANEDEFHNYIKAEYTSRSGFISSYSAWSSDWLEDAKHGVNMVSAEHKIGAMLQFALLNQDEDIENEMIEYVMPAIEISEHCNLETA